MLVVSQKEGERLRIGNEIMVSVLELRGGKVRLGIEAPAELLIERLPPLAAGARSGGRKEEEKPKKS